VAQYRSLLINGGAATGATVSQSGAGVMNLAASMSGTVAAIPTSLNFGTAGGTLQLMLTNLGAAGDTYTIQAQPVNGPAPAVTGSVQIDASASQQIPVTLDGSSLAAGEYSGYLLVTGSNSQTSARIPYWYAVRGGGPLGISVLYQDYSDSVRTTSIQAVVIRVVDASGLPYTGNLMPQLSVSGAGAVRAFYRIGDIPGTYAVDIRTGTSNIDLTFTIGTVSTDVVIPVG
jgi:hypothetical protein